MYKGKHICVSMIKLEEKISNYLDVDFKLITSKEIKDDVQEIVSVFLEIEKTDIKDIQIKELISKIIGKDKNLLEESIFNIENRNKLIFNLTDCSFMLGNIFEIKDDVIFNSEGIITNEDKKIYLIYKIHPEKIINLYRYNCECGASFKIESEIGDNGIYYCPYCGIKRDSMGEDAFDGEFLYNIEEH